MGSDDAFRRTKVWISVAFVIAMATVVCVAQVFLGRPAYGAPWLIAPPGVPQDLGRVSPVEAKISSLVIGSDGRVYLGTSDYGKVVIYDPGTGTFVNKGQACPGGTVVHSLAKSLDGTIFGGTNNNGFLFSYSPSNDVFSYPGQAVNGEDELRVLVQTNAGPVIGGTAPSGHLFKLDSGAGSQPIDLGQPAPGETMINALVEGGDGLVYGATSPTGYVFSLNPTTANVQVLGVTNSGINALVSVGDSIYIGTASGHLASYSSQSGVVDLGLIVSGERSILTLASGPYGNIYGGTYPGGYIFAYNVASRSLVGTWQAIAGESSVSVLAVAPDNSIFAGTGPEGRLVQFTAVPPTPNPTATNTPMPTPTNTPTPTYTATPTPTPADTTPPVSNVILSGTPGSDEWFTGDVSVTLNAQDDRSRVASINFSLDNANWQAYPGPFTVSNEGSHNLSFYAVDNAGNNENVKQVVINIDKSNPAIVVNSPVNKDYLHSENITLDFQAQDSISGIAQVTGTLDGAAVTTGQSIDLFQYSVPSNHTLVDNAADSAGNISSQSVTFRVIANIQSTISDVNRLEASGEITDQTYAESLIERLNSAQSAMDRGDYVTANNKLNSAKSSLDAQLGKGISPYAYKMLTDDINYVISTLPVAGPKNGPNAVN